MTSLSSSRPLALVTGASAGIGASFARALAARGYDLALVARRLDRLEELAKDLRARSTIEAFPIQADLSLAEAHLPVMAALKERGRSVDMLVNNAGFSIPKTFAATQWAEQRDFTMTLVMAVAGLTHAVLPDMLARGRGSIVNVSSMTALSPGGAGQHFGGDGAVRRIRALRPATVSVVASSRIVSPFGLAGGSDGAVGRQRVERADGAVESLAGVARVELRPGDVIVIETPGGGGWGKAGEPTS